VQAAHIATVRHALRRISALFLAVAVLLAGCSTSDEPSRPPQLGVKANDKLSFSTKRKNVKIQAPARLATR